MVRWGRESSPPPPPPKIFAQRIRITLNFENVTCYASKIAASQQSFFDTLAREDIFAFSKESPGGLPF